MTITFLLCLLPVLILPWIAKLIWPHEITWPEFGITMAAGVAVTSIVLVSGMFGAVMDVEILNGQVVSKARTHGSYLRSYECNCTTTSDGKGGSTTSCQTCYEQHYTVDWKVRSDIGSFTIDALDSTSSSVYASPDPHFYVQAKPGDPVAKKHNHVNYVKAAPNSLVRAWNTEKFQKITPEYPSNTFNFYSLNRALPVGVNIPDVGEWNKDISMALRRLGPLCQANVIVVFANADQSFMQAIEGKWLNGKKNDIIVVIGVSQYPKIDWVSVSSWTKNEMFKIRLRDDIAALGTIDRPKIMTAIETNTMNYFKRREMKDFEYLRNEIEPPTWVLTLGLILGIMTSLGASYYFYRNDPFGNGSGRRNNRFRY